MTEVCKDLVRTLIPRTAKIVVAGMPQAVELEAEMKSGRREKVTGFTVEAEEGVFENGQLVINRVGEQDIRFHDEGESATMSVRVVENLPLPAGFTLRQYGPEEGRALALADGSYELYSTANNVWW